MQMRYPIETKTKMPKAYSYIRFSSVKQLKGSSIKRQIDLRDQYLKLHPELELDTVLRFEDLGVSAFNDKNAKKGDFGRFLQCVEDGIVPQGSFLLVESFDRLTRTKPIDALPRFLDLINAGITVVTVVDHQVHSRETISANPIGLMMSIAHMIRSNEESSSKSRHLRSAWDAKRLNIGKKRLTARCPYWLKPADGESGFEFIPERVDVVKRIFQMSKDGMGNATIVKRLNGEKVPPFSSKSDGWQNSYIHKILSSKAVYGEFQPSLQRDGLITACDPIQDYYPSLMSKEDWLLVSSIREGRKTRGGVGKGKHLSNLFSGLLKCGYCGSSMNMGGYVSKKANGEKRSGKYVACSSARRGNGCNYIQWEYGDFENQVLRFCKSVDFAKVLNAQSNSGQEVDEARKRVIRIGLEINEHQSKLQNLVNALEAGGGESPLASILKRVGELEIVIEELTYQKQLAEKEVVLLSAESVQNSIQQATIVELLQQLNSLQGTDLHDLRIRLSQAIKRSISGIKIYAGGKWYEESELQELKKSLKEAGYDGKRIKDHLSSYDRKPNKLARLMTLYFHNGEVRTVVAGKTLDSKLPTP